MGTRTGKIVYNVNHRGRKHRGRDRNFDTAALASLINGGEVQERVKNRDLLGYYGHWPRIKFGMNPVEGTVLDGRAVALEPAIVTTSLKAMPDGTIEHEVEFLDTGAGRLAERLYKSKAGGFSSAIDTRRAGDKLMPVGFYGFDYVLEPNYTTNRGYTLDGVQDLDSESLLILDEVAEYRATLDAVNALFDSLQRDFELQQQTVESLAAENEELLSMLAKRDGKKPEPVMDGVAPDLVGGGETLLDRADEFKALDLPTDEVQPEETTVKLERTPGEQATGNFFTRRFGFRA